MLEKTCEMCSKSKSLKEFFVAPGDGAASWHGTSKYCIECHDKGIDPWQQASRAATDELKKKAALYDNLRVLTPQEFTELYRKNISTGVSFDELLDKWPE